MKQHHYEVGMKWVGNQGVGTKSYATYSRNHVYSQPGKPEIPGSSDVAFRGDPTRYSPEDLLVGAISSCHMLWYLHLCSTHGIIVEEYDDHAAGVMEEFADGNGRFTSITLRPRIVISKGDAAKANALHEQAHHFCFIANSVNFPVTCEPMLVER